MVELAEASTSISIVELSFVKGRNYLSSTQREVVCYCSHVRTAFFRLTQYVAAQYSQPCTLGPTPTLVELTNRIVGTFNIVESFVLRNAVICFGVSRSSRCLRHVKEQSSLQSDEGELGIH